MQPRLMSALVLGHLSPASKASEASEASEAVSCYVLIGVSKNHRRKYF